MTGVHRLLTWMGLPVVGLALLGAMRPPSGPSPLLINESPSLPQGLYRRQGNAPVSRGAVVAVAQPPAWRPYLESLGTPAGTGLLKRVAAVGGDQVCADARGVIVPGRRVTVRILDGAGARLPRWTGCRRLGPQELFLLGDTAESFDSRYFGPVRVKEVAGPYQEVVLW